MLNSLKLHYKLKNKRFFFCSRFILKLYKKFLSSKLTIYYNKCNYKNIRNSRLKVNQTQLLARSKIFYNRKEFVPLRILRYYLYFNPLTLISLGATTLISSKITVYNGKKAKPINIYKV